MKRQRAINRVLFAIGAVFALLYAFPFFMVLLNSLAAFVPPLVGGFWLFGSLY